MNTEDFEKGQETGSRETELAIVQWIDAQASVARVHRKYMASWLTRLARAIENGEHARTVARELL